MPVTPAQMAALADAGRDPWMWRLMPAALVLAIVGITMSLFIKRRRLWVSAPPDRDTVAIAGVARGDSADMSEDVAALAQQLAPVGVSVGRDPSPGGDIP